MLKVGNLITVLVMLIALAIPAESKLRPHSEMATPTYEVRGKIQKVVIGTVIPNAPVVEYTDDELVRDAAEIIKYHEGFSAKPYLCTSGKWTQGYGRQIGTRHRAPVSKQTAEAWLHEDIRSVMSDLDTLAPWWRKLSPVRKQAMVNFMYNIGPTSFQGFTEFQKAAQVGKFTAAARELKYTKGTKTKYWKKVGNRAEQVAHAIKFGTWDEDLFAEIMV